MAVRAGAPRPPQLDLITTPSIRVMDIWNWFWQLDNCRDGNAPLTHQEIYSWMQVYSIKPSNFQMQALRQMDFTSINTRAEMHRSLTNV
jgi:hypothetical protein